MKCALCKKEVDIVYLDKVAGTHIKDAKGKRVLICSACQTECENDKQKMLKKIQ